MRNIFKLILFVGCVLTTTQTAVAQKSHAEDKCYKLWYDAPAPNGGGTFRTGETDRPIDLDWENWSLPIGNGYMGASVFGRTDSERLQITDKTLYVKGIWGYETQTSFADLYLDFHHPTRSNYQRSLTLNDAVCRVSYDYDQTHYEREYFVSYPDNVLVVKLKANKSGKLSFTVRPHLPYLVPFGPLQRTDSITKGYLSGRTQSRHSYNGRTGKVTANDHTITLRGNTEYLKLIYEGQLRVIPSGGKMYAENDDCQDNGKIHVANADSAIILFTLGTNYKLESKTFVLPPSQKLEGNPDPHQQITETLARASAKSYRELLDRHKADYTSFFDRVKLDLGGKEPEVPTDCLLADYKAGKHSNYLEELFFQYGRYLLISTSRKGTLPPTLQGVWNQYEQAPWNGNYTHNINIQMNYWPAFSTNLAELFESYADYHKAYREAAEKVADRYVKIHKPALYSSQKGENGWVVGTSANAYSISSPGGHSGPGTGGFTANLFWEYYQFTADKAVLRDTSYPALLSMSRFLSKAVQDTLGYTLAYPSASPEQYSKETNRPYPTVGCAFDQQMIDENHRCVIESAKLLGQRSPFINLLQKQIKRLDPVQVGASGQIKEYREEKEYGDIVLEPHHRHISNLIGLYPGTLINETTPQWLEAAKVTLNRRGDLSTGWSMAHKMNLWARCKEGDRAHQLLQGLLKTATLNNLWTNCIAVLRSPYQIDANFGGTAGIAEMLLQSHEGYIAPLSALPTAWKDGSYCGLVARGFFEVTAHWQNGVATRFDIHSRKGSRCSVKYPQIGRAALTDSKGAPVRYKVENNDLITFNTVMGETYNVTLLP